MPIFIASVLALIILLWGLGWYAKRWVRTDGDFLLAGRQVSLIPGIASICGIAFAGSMTSIVPGLTIQYGFLGWILGGSLPLVIGYIAYGVFAGPYIRRCGAYTIPEWLEMRFDTRTRVVVSIATLLGVTGVVAMNVVAMALIMQGFLGAPLWADDYHCPGRTPDVYFSGRDVGADADRCGAGPAGLPLPAGPGRLLSCQLWRLGTDRDEFRYRYAFLLRGTRLLSVVSGKLSERADGFARGRLFYSVGRQLLLAARRGRADRTDCPLAVHYRRAARPGDPWFHGGCSACTPAVSTAPLFWTP